MLPIIVALLLIYGEVVSAGPSVYYNSVENLKLGLFNGYSSATKPDQSVDVYIRFNLLDLKHQVEDEELVFIKGQITMIWLDQSLQWTPSSSAGNGITQFRVKESEVWRPELHIENGFSDDSIIFAENTYAMVDSTGVVMWDVPVSTRLYCDLDHTYFPFDRQTCEINITSFSFSNDQLPLTPIDADVVTDFYHGNPAWILESTSARKTEHTKTIPMATPISRQFSKVTFSLNLKRNTSTFYGLTVFFPLILLSILGLLTFVLQPRGGEKMTFAVVVCLAYWLLYVKILDEIPVASQPPVLSIYITVVAVKIVVLVICATFTTHISHKDTTSAKMSSQVISIKSLLMKLTCTSPTSTNTEIVVNPVNNVPNLHSSEPIQSNSQENHVFKLEENQAEISDVGQPPRTTKLPGKPVQIPRRLSPLHKNRVWPVNGVHEENTQVLSSAEDGEHLSSASEQTHMWEDLAASLDKFFFIIFVFVSVVLHMVFIIIIAT